jgi:hypothetical protein
MIPKRFTDPLGSTLPALEQNILKYRAMEMLLVMFYAEELKREVLDCIQTSDRGRAGLRRVGLSVFRMESRTPWKRH